MLSFDNIIISARNANKLEQIRSDEEVLAYLPMAWVGDHIFSYGQAVVAGFTVNCPESADTVMIDLRELGPTFFFAPPAIFESILTQVTIRMEDAGWLKKWIYARFMAVARLGLADSRGSVGSHVGPHPLRAGATFGLWTAAQCARL